MTASQPKGGVDRPTFVDGIGPPLQQLLEDYADAPNLVQRDVVALIRAYLDLEAALRDADGHLKVYEDEASHGKTANVSLLDMCVRKARAVLAQPQDRGSE